eukprot:CAMPEP_0170182180 /NCGR_PEP_ID=MMETSP0040_2-20121228/27200_1 /TAXON_ID=641309 /ORGANISM="Lotharella oceanica, Strain CCMP622" /LENGTH=88 /DNA_ID=CAMNT_0010427511 /DNA_START=558 /DNA_END=825 /DNA_ORIENTATION=-
MTCIRTVDLHMGHHVQIPHTVRYGLPSTDGAVRRLEIQAELQVALESHCLGALVATQLTMKRRSILTVRAFVFGERCEGGGGVVAVRA